MRVRLLATWCLAVGLLGLWGGGCGPSTSGGGGRPFQGGPSGAPTAAGGVNRDPLGYTFGVAQVSSAVGGRVTALVAVPGSTTDDLAAHAPLRQVTRLSQGQPVALETTFAADTTDLVGLGAQAFAATADRTLSGVGDVFRRVEQTPGVPTWSAVLDTNDSEATVAALTSANRLAAATGGEGRDGTLWTLDGTSLAIVSSRSLGAVVPTASLEFPQGSGQVYVGTTTNASGGSAAGLLRVDAAGPVSLNLPSAGAQAGVREEVSALARIVDGLGTERLAVAVARTNLVSGAPLGGAVYVTDGASFTQVATLAQNDAPTALAFTDNTLYLGTALGQLLFLDDQGAAQPEPGLPTLTRIDSLLVRDAKTLRIGGSTAAGAAVVTRSGNSP